MNIHRTVKERGLAGDLTNKHSTHTGSDRAH
jgi:hypothetical protein